MPFLLAFTLFLGQLIMQFTTENLDYLQRTGQKFTPSRLDPAKIQGASRRHVIQVRGVGRLDKSSAADTRQTAVSDWQLTQLISEDLLVGLYGLGEPIAFLINGEPGSVSLYIGIWGPQESAASSGASTKALAAILNGVYPGIELDESVDLQKAVGKNFSAAGLVLGIPTAKPPDLTDGAFAIDRLIRSLTEVAWQGLILAEPIPEG